MNDFRGRQLVESIGISKVLGNGNSHGQILRVVSSELTPWRLSDKYPAPKNIFLHSTEPDRQAVTQPV